MTRKIPEWDDDLDLSILPKLSEILIELRNMANQQPGYISGETMRNVDDRNEYLIISTWKSRESWERWLNHRKRVEIESQLEELIGAPTIYKIYSYD
jgi:heme-degrading monooxygenase HmoA